MKRMICKTSPFLTILLLFALEGYALPNGWYSVNTVSGTTNNLFMDSSDVDDSFSNLNFVYEQPLNDNFLLFYDGFAELYYETADLTYHDHTAGVEAGKYLSDRGEIFTGISGFVLNYREAYELYNRRGMRLNSGFRWISSPFVRWRTGVDASINEYPNDDTLAVSYYDAYMYLGTNIATRQKVAFDIAPGIQIRRYYELDTPANTSYFWVNSRVSKPLYHNLGASLRATYREQLSISGDDIFALIKGGIDPGDLLWTGYSASAFLNYGKLPWFLSLGIVLSHSEYEEVFSVDEQQQRIDDVQEIRIQGKYVIKTPDRWPMLSIGSNLSYTNNESSSEFYTYKGFSASAFLTIRSR